jgi:hypothetical protein
MQAFYESWFRSCKKDLLFAEYDILAESGVVWSFYYVMECTCWRSFKIWTYCTEKLGIRRYGALSLVSVSRTSGNNYVE